MRVYDSRLSQEQVYRLLLLGDNDFVPSIHESIDIEAYAGKLSKFASFILVEEDDDIRGCIAYYKNLEGNFIYISHFWVSSLYQRRHYGSRMLETLIASYRDEYHEIRLEVVKSNPAYLFYLTHGFCVKEDRGHKYLLLLKL